MIELSDWALCHSGDDVFGRLGAGATQCVNWTLMAEHWATLLKKSGYHIRKRGCVL